MARDGEQILSRGWRLTRRRAARDALAVGVVLGAVGGDGGVPGTAAVRLRRNPCDPFGLPSVRRRQTSRFCRFRPLAKSAADALPACRAPFAYGHPRKRGRQGTRARLPSDRPGPPPSASALTRSSRRTGATQASPRFGAQPRRSAEAIKGISYQTTKTWPPSPEHAVRGQPVVAGGVGGVPWSWRCRACPARAAFRRPASRPEGTAVQEVGGAHHLEAHPGEAGGVGEGDRGCSAAPRSWRRLSRQSSRRPARPPAARPRARAGGGDVDGDD